MLDHKGEFMSVSTCLLSVDHSVASFTSAAFSCQYQGTGCDLRVVASSVGLRLHLQYVFQNSFLSSQIGADVNMNVLPRIRYIESDIVRSESANVEINQQYARPRCNVQRGECKLPNYLHAFK